MNEKNTPFCEYFLQFFLFIHYCFVAPICDFIWRYWNEGSFIRFSTGTFYFDFWIKRNCTESAHALVQEAISSKTRQTNCHKNGDCSPSGFKSCHIKDHQLSYRPILWQMVINCFENFDNKFYLIALFLINVGNIRWPTTWQ